MKFRRTSFTLTALATAITLAWAAPAGAEASKPVAYVSSQDTGVSIISLDTLEPIGMVETEAKGPRGIGVTADGKYLVTANRGGADATVFDIAANKVVKHIPIGKNPEFVRVKGNYAFVTFEPSSKGGPPPKPGSAEAKEDDDDDEPKVPAKIAVVDLKQLKVIRNITSGPETEGIEFTPDGKRMLVTNEADNTVTVHSIRTGKRLKTIDTHKHGDRPRGVKVSPDGSTYVVTLEYGDKVMVLDKDFNFVKTFATGKTPYGISFDRAGKRLFVAASKEKQLQVFDAKSFELIKAIPTAERCWHFTFTPDDSKILVACGRSDNVLIFDATTYEKIKELPVKGMPWGVISSPKAMGSLDQP